MAQFSDDGEKRSSYYEPAPTVAIFYNVDDKVYTVCINSYHLYTAVHEVQLNLSGSVTKFEGAEFVEPLVTSINNIIICPPHSHCQNFINVDHIIFFADLEYSAYHDTL